LEYPDRVSQIKTMLNNVLSLPALTPSIHLPYVIRPQDPNWDFPHGKLLIQYDPLQQWFQRAGQTCPEQWARLEVWLEEAIPNPRLFDDWQAFPNQIMLSAAGP
jgi:hypothetical protein